MKSPQCTDCAFHGVEPAICDECREADQFEESSNDDTVQTAPIYFHDWKQPV